MLNQQVRGTFIKACATDLLPDSQWPLRSWPVSKVEYEDAHGGPLFSWGMGQGLPVSSFQAPVFKYDACRTEPDKPEAQLAVPMENSLTALTHSHSNIVTQIPWSSLRSNLKTCLYNGEKSQVSRSTAVVLVVVV